MEYLYWLLALVAVVLVFRWLVRDHTNHMDSLPKEDREYIDRESGL